MQAKLIQLLIWVITGLKSWTTGAISTAKSEAISDAGTYTDTQVADAISTAAADATSKANTAAQDAKDYAVAQDLLKSASDRSYADGIVNDAKIDVNNYTDSQVTNAINTAATDATNKANTAKSEANSYTDTQVTSVTSTLETYADNAANSAQSTAISQAQTYADGAASTAESNAKSYADGLFADAQTYLGNNLTLIPFTLSGDTNLNGVLTDASVSGKLQTGLNAIQFIVADTAEYIVSGVTGEVGHMDILCFSWDGNTATDLVLADDRATQLAASAEAAAIAAADFNLQQVKDAIAAANLGVTFP